MERVETPNVCFQLCLWPVWVTATAKQMLKQLGRVGGCFYSRNAPPSPLLSSRLMIAHQSCRQSVKADFIVRLLRAVVGFSRSRSEPSLQSGGLQMGADTDTDEFWVLKQETENQSVSV